MKALGIVGIAAFFAFASLPGWWLLPFLLLFGAFILFLLPQKPPRELLHEPRVSVIIPMRNEEANARACLDSLSKLRYTNMEALIVDDRSTDATPEILRQWLAGYAGEKEFKLFTTPSAPPEGWVGKTFAIDSILPHATGKLILVADADIDHAPDSLLRSVSALEEKRVDLLSRTPHIRITHAGQMVLGLVFFLLSFGSWLCQRLGARQAFATGMYALFSKEAYLLTGGWKVAREFPETPALARLFAARGRTYSTMASAGQEMATPMYGSLKEAAVGMIRNTNYQTMPPLPLMVVSFVVAYEVYSASLLALEGAQQLGGALGLGLVSLAFCGYLLHSKNPPATAVLGGIMAFPLTLFAAALATLSALRHALGFSVSWRGRKMPFQ